MSWLAFKSVTLNWNTVSIGCKCGSLCSYLCTPTAVLSWLIFGLLIKMEFCPVSVILCWYNGYDIGLLCMIAQLLQNRSIYTVCWWSVHNNWLLCIILIGVTGVHQCLCNGFFIYGEQGEQKVLAWKLESISRFRMFSVQVSLYQFYQESVKASRNMKNNDTWFILFTKCTLDHCWPFPKAGFSVLCVWM